MVHRYLEENQIGFSLYQKFNGLKLVIADLLEANIRGGWI